MKLIFQILSYCLIVFSFYYSAYSQASSFDDAGRKFLDALIKNDIELIKSMQATPDIYRKVAPNQMLNLDDEAVMSIVNDNEFSMHNKFRLIISDLALTSIDRSKLKLINSREKKYAFIKVVWKTVEIYFDYLGAKDTLLIELYEKDRKWYLIDIANDDKEFFNIIQKKGLNASKEFYQAGLRARDKKEFYDAAHDFSFAARLDSTYFEAWYEAGYALIELDNYKDAKESLSMSLKMDKHGVYHSYIYLEMGYIAKAENDLLNAETYFKESIKADSSQYFSYYYLGTIAYDGKDYKQAIEYLRYAIQNDNEERYYTHYLQGMSYFNTKEYQRASYAFIDALERNPNNSQTLYQLGWVYNELEEFSMAVTVFDALLRIDKNNYDAMYELAYAYLKMENFVSALEFFSKVEEAVISEWTSTINYARLCRHLGDCHLAFGERDEACKYYKLAAAVKDEVNPQKMKKACSK